MYGRYFITWLLLLGILPLKLHEPKKKIRRHMISINMHVERDIQ